MRLGDLDDVVDFIQSYKVGRIAKSELLWALSQQPTIDAVPVVRCKDCKWCSMGTMFQSFFCKGRGVKSDDFCSCGERRAE